MSSKWLRLKCTPMWWATAAPTMEKAMPSAAMTQNGRTSLTKWDRPLLPQAHWRFSQ